MPGSLVSDLGVFGHVGCETLEGAKLKNINFNAGKNVSIGQWFPDLVLEPGTVDGIMYFNGYLVMT